MRDTHFISKETELFVSLAEVPGNTGTLWFNKIFTEFKINAIYKSFQIHRNEFESAMKGIRALKISGGAISMPFKKEAIGLVDKISGVANQIGTINTFKKGKNGELVGFNTDYIAAHRALPEKTTAIYLLGTGGVSAAIAYAIHEKQLAPLTIISRRKEPHCIPKEVQFEWRDWNDLPKLPPPQVVINATSLGMTAQLELEIPNFWWPDIEHAIDLTYRLEGTQFANKAKANQIKFIDGKKFANWQALEQLKIYTGIEITEEQSGY